MLCHFIEGCPHPSTRRRLRDGRRTGRILLSQVCTTSGTSTVFNKHLVSEQMRAPFGYCYYCLLLLRPNNMANYLTFSTCPALLKSVTYTKSLNSHNPRCRTTFPHFINEEMRHRHVK